MRNPRDNPFRKRGGIKPMSAEEAKQKINGEELEKNDPLAMVIAAFVTFLPAVIVVIGLLVWVSYRFLIR